MDIFLSCVPVSCLQLKEMSLIFLCPGTSYCSWVPFLTLRWKLWIGFGERNCKRKCWLWYYLHTQGQTVKSTRRAAALAIGTLLTFWRTTDCASSLASGLASLNRKQPFNMTGRMSREFEKMHSLCTWSVTSCCYGCHGLVARMLGLDYIAIISWSNRCPSVSLYWFWFFNYLLHMLWFFREDDFSCIHFSWPKPAVT